jgi:hypothetical protein
MIPAEVEPDDLRPVLGDLEGGNLDAVLGNREDAPLAQGRYAIGPSLADVLGVALDDPLAIVVAVVLHVEDRHGRHVPHESPPVSWILADNSLLSDLTLRGGPVFSGRL